MSSRLFQEVREDRGLCYTIHTFHMPYSDSGCSRSMPAPMTAAPELMHVVMDEIGPATASLNETEVARAKTQLKTGLLMALESSGARIGQLARQMLAYGRPIPLDEIVAKVDAVTVEFRAPPAASCSPPPPARAALGPGTGLESAATIAEVWPAKPLEKGSIPPPQRPMALFRTVSLSENPCRPSPASA